MINDTANPLLARVMRQIRRDRPAIPRDQDHYNRIERVPAGWYVETWFMTGGCRWDASGGCTMCNYGRGASLSSNEMVGAVDRALSELSIHVNELMVSPSGSMLDANEVPIEARLGIYHLVQKFPTERYFVETRVETVTADALDELRDAVPDKALIVEVGLESANPWVQRYCVNKGNEPSQFIDAARKLKARGIHMYCNVALGLPFLSLRESVEDATASILWALDNGADVVDLFPIHVKPYTLTEFLYGQGWYRPVSLWALVRVLHLLGPEITRRTEISWYKSYFPEGSGLISASPTTCPECITGVMALLDEYRATQDWLVIERLNLIECGCREDRNRSYDINPEESLPDRVLGWYDRIIEATPDQEWRLGERGALASEMGAGVGSHLKSTNTGALVRFSDSKAALWEERKNLPGTNAVIAPLPPLIE